ncbi:MAG: polysaccharide biosynthesis tyrosine autokinase [Spartobacteria bacterium]|nr:polysaccharide biosynthesis tyrosine autokinase [Spartobacteria bacterium]
MNQMDQDDVDFQQAGGDESEIHLWDYVGIVLRRLPMVIAVFSIILILGIIYTWTRTPLYEATSRVLVEASSVNLTGMQDAMEDGRMSQQAEFMNTQAELLKSQPVLEATFVKANLANDPVFGEMKNPVKALADSLEISILRRTSLIDVSISHPNPVYAARIVNAVIESYLDETRKRRQGISEEGIEELRRQADSLRQDLDVSTRALQDFMVKNNVVSFEKTQNIIIERLQDLSRNLTKIEPLRMGLQAKKQSADHAVEEGVSVDSLPDVIDSPVIRSLKIDLARLETEYSQKQERLGESHPQLAALRNEMQTLQMKIAFEASSILQSLGIQYNQAIEEERLAREALNEHKLEVFRMAELNSEYQLLQQSRTTIESAYNRIIKRIQEIDVNRMSRQGENVFVISKALVPQNPSWPRKMRNLAITIVLAMGMAVGLAFFVDYMDMTVKSDFDVRHMLKTDLLVGVPSAETDEKGKGAADLSALGNHRSQFAEAFRALRTVLGFRETTTALHAVAVTSTFPQEGKSIISINLAVAQAQVGKRTLLVDTDMRKPRLNKVFGMDNKKGLSNILIGDDSVRLDDVIMQTEVENLYFMPCGPIPPHPVELLEKPEFARLVAHVKERFDFVVFDTPPSHNLVDSMVIGKMIDGIMLVVRSFSTPKQAAKSVADRIHQATNIRLLGVILNNIDEPKSRGYYGGYYYGRYYGKYYKYEEDEKADRA